jgi:2-dehydropantoate 2-reductase
MNGSPWWFFQEFAGPWQGRTLQTLDPDGLLTRTIPFARVVWGTINCAVAERDGDIYHTILRQLELGRPNGSAEGLAEIADVFIKGRYEALLRPKIRDALWVKLQSNLMNPLSALAMADSNKLAGDPLVLELFIGMARELRSVALKLGIDCGPDPAERFGGLRANAPAIRSSMLQDADRGRPLEIDSILGAAVEIAEVIGVPAPLTRAVYGLARVRSGGLAAAAS